MSTLTIESLKQALLTAGMEIYRVNGTEIRVAERVRMHLMDSGVTLFIDSGSQVSLTVRSQRSDFPSMPAENLFQKIRDVLQTAIEERGFSEVRAATRNITDPVDQGHVLDVWHELTFAKNVDDLSTLLEDVRWALQVPKCVDR